MLYTIYNTKYNINISDISLTQLFEKFQSLNVVFSDMFTATDANPAVRLDLGRRLKEVFRRQIAAETIGLDQNESAAITEETFWLKKLAHSLSALSPKGMKTGTGRSQSTALLWGFLKSAQMTDEGLQPGLTLTRDYFMRRSGLSFGEVLQLVQTQFFCERLVIVNTKGSTVFDGKLEQLRLRSNVTGPRFQPLTEDICFTTNLILRDQRPNTEASVNHAHHHQDNI